ncbi:septum site-determining protein MinD [Vibrio breoganii]
MTTIISVTSGKGGVGKTTSSANIATALALLGKKTCVIDFDVGLPNLHTTTGVERRVVYDFVQVMQRPDDYKLTQALIKDRRVPDDLLYIFPTSENKDKDILTQDGVERILNELKSMDFDYIVCDSPAGIEEGARMAMYFADIAIIATNPELSSVSDSNRMIGVIDSKSRRAVQGNDPVEQMLLITRYNPTLVAQGEMLSIQDVSEILPLPLVGVVPESPDIMSASNEGKPVVHKEESRAGQAYVDTAKRIIGEDIEFRFLENEKKGIFQKLFGG